MGISFTCFYHFYGKQNNLSETNTRLSLIQDFCVCFLFSEGGQTKNAEFQQAVTARDECLFLRSCSLPKFGGVQVQELKHS